MTSIIILPGKVIPDRSKFPVAVVAGLIGPEIKVEAPEIFTPSKFCSCMLISPSGITRSFTIESDKSPALKTAEEKSSKEKLLIAGSKSKEGTFCVLPSGKALTPGNIVDNKYGSVF